MQKVKSFLNSFSLSSTWSIGFLSLFIFIVITGSVFFVLHRFSKSASSDIQSKSLQEIEEVSYKQQVLGSTTEPLVNSEVAKDKKQNRDSEIFASIKIKYDNLNYQFPERIVREIVFKNSLPNNEVAYQVADNVTISQKLKLLFPTDTAQIYQENEKGISPDIYKGFSYYKSDYTADLDQGAQQIVKLLVDRISGSESESQITIARKSRPGTNGEFSKEKYIEHDQSAQMIYAWENGQLFNSWSVSGAYDDYAVYGVFDIKNKAVKGWSSKVSKWMPNWMAFYYSESQEAWYGIHGLVHWYDANGVYNEEPATNIGIKKSAGCIRLGREEIKKLYEWAEVGTIFLNHP